MRDQRSHKFIEISVLEEEMEALRIIFEVQSRTVKALSQVLSPDFFLPRTPDWVDLDIRKNTYDLEKMLLDAHIKNLLEDGKTLEMLQRILNVTRHDMKQMMRAMGKPSEYLPLSHCSSFHSLLSRVSSE
ncbi:hypothetical protein FBEOM_7125 [Fusarium beomiforme]|uniref:Uncharacterized protein n=1 Tax=Fusarium beomiforme TaxID=44412 RepID=A0A9P5AHV8_9HYPO|nr:hypothetical protein FBEOM_7125 [Fusarium beomiforme]